MKNKHHSYIQKALPLLMFFVFSYLCTSQYYDDMRYEAVVANTEYKRINAQVLLFLNEQDTMQYINVKSKPAYSVLPLITIENHYTCDDSFVYYDIFLCAKKTFLNQSIWYLLLFHKKREDSIWRLGASSVGNVDTNDKFISNYMQTYQNPPDNGQIIRFLTKKSNLSLSCSFTWSKMVPDSTGSNSHSLVLLDATWPDTQVYSYARYVDTLNWKKMNGQNPSLSTP
ncbi:MAG: hypothetical protein IT211_04205 [Armatimonadetes bacterium]|nr:hypothetical protein [Armatimonadota bacterium]